ncbi:hypothetical protein [Halalkalibacterium ligniniphilum]|uniref:hypothetical protein n=1 Tax=Halalkalibacterium ligniniphilum TaxID=1134413 RepID=UPI000345F247|nr:hypothetical protein [Halalkalibacterium ligniniphilum]
MKWNVLRFDLDNTPFSPEKAFQKAILFCFSELMSRWECERGKLPLIESNKWFHVFKNNSNRIWQAFEQGEMDGTTYRRLRYCELLKRAGRRSI